MVQCYQNHDIPQGHSTCQHGHGTTDPSTNPTAAATGARAPSTSSLRVTSASISLTAEQLQQVITAAVQAAQQTASNDTALPSRNAEKPKRPLLTAGLNQEMWLYFLTRWERYKKLTGLDNFANASDTVAHLLECCDEDLALNLHRNVGPNIALKPELDVLKEIKALAIKEENILISRLNMRSMTQNHDEEVNHFAARLKGQAEICQYTVKCTNTGCNTLVSYAEAEIKDQLCKGLADDDIQQQLLGNKDHNMSLADTVKFISAKEAGKRTQTALTGPTNISKISPYQKAKQTNLTNSTSKSEKCGWCGNLGHGKKATFEMRQQLCPAFNKTCFKCNKLHHFGSVCHHSSQQKESKSTEAEVKPHNDSNHNAIMLGKIDCANHKIEMNKSTKPVPHSICQADNWLMKQSDEDPKITVQIQTCPTGYDMHNLPIKKSKTVSWTIIAQTLGQGPPCQAWDWSEPWVLMKKIYFLLHKNYVVPIPLA